MKKPCSATDPLWYKDAVIYELHVRAFADSNADGIGDFQGLISKLDYLQELGVTCLWLLPFFPSPLRDDGYDIADYTSVNPSYGTVADFQQFLSEAHARNLQVMIELVINHTSDQHPWFQRARLAPKDFPDRNMYVWSDTDKKFEGVRIIFTDTEKSNWTWDDVAQQYYWHRFFAHQPDLNFDNPRVMDEVLKAMRFWLDMGVDGLRLDAIPYIIERDGTSCENLPETHAKIKQILLASKLATARAWELKEAFGHFWKYKSPLWAGAFLDVWCQRAQRSRLEPMQKVARMLRSHEELLMNCFRAKGEISSGAVEGLNNKIRVVTRRSYGFRTYKATKIALYHTLGRLPERESAHKYC